MAFGELALVEEHALIERAQRDQEAFGELYERYVERIHAFAFARLSSKSDADDATSEVFLRALRAIGRYRQTDKSFGAWLYRIAANLITDRYRRRRPTSSLDDLREALPSVDFTEAVLERVAGRVVWEAVDRLPRQQRIAITLHFCADLSTRAIAEVMEKSIPAVKLLIFRGIRGLRRDLARETDHEVEQRRQLSAKYV